jgi:succinoglycan biosynthesis protein ExoL
MSSLRISDKPSTLRDRLARGLGNTAKAMVDPPVALPKIVYFVHDLSDPAVNRRLRMFRAEPAELVLIGFRRSRTAVRTIDGIVPIDLGRTQDRRLARRVGSVLNALATLHRHRDALQHATVIVARQLEMLVIADAARRHFSPQAPLVYECLDIHRLMTARGPAGSLLRRLEAAMLRRCALLVVSSPAFLNAYFEPVHRRLPQTCLLENKVLASEVGSDGSDENADGPMRTGPPWRIGWYGGLRCMYSLRLLTALVKRLPGQVEVVIRGKPDRAEMPRFDEIVAAAPGIAFGGPYDLRQELRGMYSAVHFAWTVDFSDAAANSKWLLPNRLYEGGWHGAVPIAFRPTQTGQWLAKFGAGILLDEPIAESLAEFFRTLDSSRYLVEKAAFSRVPATALIYDDRDCREFCRLLLGLQPAA